MVEPVRTLVVWCLDWPVVATGEDLTEPLAVVFANRVVASSPPARRHGVAKGQRRRAAQGSCPELRIVERDLAKEARLFEPVVASLDDVTPRVEITRPGMCAFAMRGPGRYFGGDQAVARLVYERASAVVDGRTGIRVGVADGVFAAGLAARKADPVEIVAPGDTSAFLAPLTVKVLPNAELVDVLVRLGIRTLGGFAALDGADVLARFGNEGLRAHRLASGLDERPPDACRPPPDWSVSVEIDPPAEQIDRAAFAARTLADELHRRLGADGVSCMRVGVEAETEHGETLFRLWRHEGALSDAAVADRVRWQLDGWLHGSAVSRPSGGIIRLSLIPDELIPAKGRQLGFWGGETEVDQRAARAAARLKGQLGADAVLVPQLAGGRHHDEQLELVSAATVELAGRSLVSSGELAPWPGSLPAPSPTRVLHQPIVVDVAGVDGETVAVTGRGILTTTPAVVADGRRRFEIARWAGPWPVNERWWDADGHARQARLQVVTVDGRAWLVVLSKHQWCITAEWD